MKPLHLRLGGGAEFPHLPAGREPGAQSLRGRAQRNIVMPLVGFVGTAMFAAGVWVSAGGRGAKFDRQDELLGGVVFAAFGLLVVYVALLTWEKGRRERHPRLRGTTLAADDDVLRRGDEVSVTLTRRGTSGGRVDVGIVCNERYDSQVLVGLRRGGSMVVRETAEASVHEQWQAVPPGTGEQTFRFQVPVDAPYSYEGDCVSFAWRASARAVRRLRTDARLDVPIWVQP